MTSLAFLILRCVVGGLIAGHGAQKLFGFSNGPGPAGTRQFMAKLGLRPEERWAFVAGWSEFAGGALTLLGFLNPLGPLAAIGAMVTASLTAHKGKPIWSTAGGAELPVTNMAVLVAVALAGPGKLGLDTVLGTRVPWWMSFLAVTAVGGAVAYTAAPPPLALPGPSPEAALPAAESDVEMPVEATA